MIFESETEVKPETKTVLVTGGTGAIGSEIVRALVRSYPDFQIIANYSHNHERAEKLRAETGCALYRADISSENAVQELFFSRFPSPLYAVIHAAGITRDALLLRQTRAEWDQNLSINLESAFLVARASLEKLEEGGRLIFLASRVGETGNRGQSAYAAAKAALLALAKSAAREGARRCLKINAICPGFVPSAMTENLSAPALEAAQKASLFGEFGAAEETAELVAWLLSPGSGNISGQVFHADNRL